MWTLSKINAELQCLYDNKLTVGKDDGHHTIMYAYLSVTETYIGPCGGKHLLTRGKSGLIRFGHSVFQAI